MVQRAINDTVYGEENRKIVTDLFVGNLTYEAVAASVPISTRGLHKRMSVIVPKVENYLQRMN